jgi:hypothetical protein
MWSSTPARPEASVPAAAHLWHGWRALLGVLYGHHPKSRTPAEGYRLGWWFDLGVVSATVTLGVLALSAG